MMTPEEILQNYTDKGCRIVMWPEDGGDASKYGLDMKGPTETGWLTKEYPLEGWKPEGVRCGLLLGHEIKPGHFLADVDIDWSPGAEIAAALLPPTGLIFGRASKRLSHAFYTLPTNLPSMIFVDTDKTMLLELRCAKSDGSIGHETMVPPSMWSKDGKREPLQFARELGDIYHFNELEDATATVQLVAITMILARALGKYGFGHEARLAWAGHMIRLDRFHIDNLKIMGNVISQYCENSELGDVDVVLESSLKTLKAGRQVTGGPTLAKILGERGPAIISRIGEWLGRDQDFERSKTGIPFGDHQGNIRRALTLMEVQLSYDEFAERALISEGSDPPVTMEDAKLNNLWLRMDRMYRLRPTKDFYYTMLPDLARENSFHPVCDYLARLKWDGVPRVDTWLTKFGGAADTPYTRAVGALFLIAACRRVRHPGCKFDEMMIWESEQGLNKSTALRTLAINDAWFTDDLPLSADSKKVIEGTLGKWIVEASDLAGKRKSDIDSLKAFMSRQIDGPARMAYARIAVERARQFVTAGTTNNRNYLVDTTGARRFWPVEVKRFDIPALLKWRDQLWAEAAHREAAGESIRLHESLWPHATAEQDERRETDPWETIIEGLVNTYVRDEFSGKRKIPSKEIWGVIGVQIDRRDQRSARRIADIMTRLGFRATKMRVTEGTVACYEEIQGQVNLPDGDS